MMQSFATDGLMSRAMERSIRRAMGRCLSVFFLALCVSACSTVKYNTLEKFGIHKRDILVGNVEDARDSQEEAQEQFKDALERFGAVVEIADTDLKKAYDQLSDEFEDSTDAAEEVSDRIEDVDEVAQDLFDEWKDEITLYTDVNFKRDSEQKLRDTQQRYAELSNAMRASEQSMVPVLATMQNNVLYLKHNLNAQAIGALQNTYGGLQTDVEILIDRMNQSIERSNRFITDMNAG